MGDGSVSFEPWQRGGGSPQFSPNGGVGHGSF